jgi:RNA polymerase sigma-70 factor (ECF subfamily)
MYQLHETQTPSTGNSDTQTVERRVVQARDAAVLFRGIAAGSEDAFQQIFNLYQPRLVSYLTRITKCSEEAQELTQEIFLKLWANREALGEVESPERYIFTIARNKAIDCLRKAALDSRMRERLWSSICTYQQSCDEEFFANERATLINEAILKLSSQKRVVFRLSRIDGLTHNQIARQLNISKNTVKNHIVEAIKFIKNYLIHQ